MRALLAAALAALLLASAGAQNATPRRITSGGCCVNPVWSPDSRRVLFIDKPGTGPAGYYAVAVDEPDGDAAAGPELAYSRVAYYSPDFRYALTPGRPSSTILRLSDNRRFSVPTTGNVAWAPGGARIAWTVSASQGNFDRRVSRVYVSSLGGSPRLVATLYGGGVSGWLDNDTLLLSGKATPSEPTRALRTLSVGSGAGRVLARALNLRGVAPSPDGKRLLYYIAFDRPGTNGLYLASTSGGAARRLPFFGSYRWRDANRLVYVPLELGVKTHRLLEYDAATNRTRTLASLDAKIEGDNWQVSPDGRRVVFMSAADNNLYVLELPR